MCIGMVTVLECHWKGIWEINRELLFIYSDYSDFILY